MTRSRLLQTKAALQLESPSLVSGEVGGLALPAYIGDRRLYPEQDSHDPARAMVSAPTAQRDRAECGRLHGRKTLANIEVRA